jgi:Tol biopolymer transport system component
MKRWSIVALALAVAMLILAGIVGPAQANVFGPNGRIVFGRFDNKLGDTVSYTVNPDGTHQQQLFSGTSEVPRWSPDGSTVALLACASPCPGDVPAIIVNPDTGAFTQLENPQFSTLFTDWECTVWSPDGSRLACGAVGTDATVNGIYTIRSSDGGDLTRVTAFPFGDGGPGDYSPDGTRIVFVHTDLKGRTGLFIVNVDGRGRQQITPQGMIVNNAYGGSWSPDGNHILFQARPSADRSYAVYEVNPDGTGLQQVPIPGCGGLNSDRGTIACRRPVWSPDGTKIALAVRSFVTGQVNIFTVNADGTGLTQVTHRDLGLEGGYVDWGTHPLTT